MSNGIVSMRSGLAVLFAASALAGCAEGGTPAQSSPTSRTNSAAIPVAHYGMIEHDALRIRHDTQRNRLWVLALDEVRVYDIAKKRKRLIRKIALPNWSVAHYLCDPHMVLDSAGTAILSSNVNPHLWLIDAVSFELTARDIRLHGKEQWDTGFRALTFAADGTLIAWTSGGESLWKIDLAMASARRIDVENPPANTCVFPAQWLNNLERNPQP